MANTYLTIAATTWHPSTDSPLSRERFFVGTEKRMANGQLRRAVAATKERHGPYTSERLSAATLASLKSAITFASSFTYVDETGASRTAVLTSWREEIVQTTPDVEGAVSGTGTHLYEVTIELEDV